MSTSIIFRLKEIQELPTLPEVVLRVQSIANSDTASADELAGVVNEDPSLAAKLLKVANSAYFGGSRHVSSVRNAVARIGFNEVRNISMAVGLIRHFSRKSAILDYGAFWRHSLTAGFLSQKLAAAGGFADAEREPLFMAALLHDVGILVLDQFFHAEFKEIVDRALQSETPYINAEREFLPSESHAVVGAALLELWHLDPAIHLAIRYHHDPARCPEHVRRSAVAVAVIEYVLCSLKLGSFEGIMAPLDPALLAQVGVSSEQLAALYEQADGEGEKAEAVLSVSHDGSLRPV